MTRIHVPIPLRWSDFDAYAHVNNAEMLRLLEEARIQAFWRPDEGGEGAVTAVLDARPGAETISLIARQEIEYLAPIPYMRAPIDIETLPSLENALLEFPGCAVVITHDRWFLDRIATHILSWEGTDEDPAKWYWFEGNFESYEENKIERLGPDAAKPNRSAYRKLTRD